MLRNCKLCGKEFMSTCNSVYCGDDCRETGTLELIRNNWRKHGRIKRLRQMPQRTIDMHARTLRDLGWTCTPPAAAALSDVTEAQE